LAISVSWRFKAISLQAAVILNGAYADTIFTKR
jgi:hypothetical protein